MADSAGESRSAKEIFARWLTAGGDFENFLRDHSEHARELDELHAAYQRLRSLLPSAGLGIATTPDAALRSDQHQSVGAEAELLLARLAARAAAARQYQERRELAQGGMGAILEVWDEELRRALAMKVMLDDSPGAAADPRALARFLEEAQVTAQLDHPGIVPVHELGIDARGRPFFTMKLVKGSDLKAIFARVFEGAEGWTETRALGVILDVCEAMAYAHAKGVLHRDLKPANVMVGSFGEVFVMDWGLALVKGRGDQRDLRLRVDGAGLSSVRTERRTLRENEPDSPIVTMDGTIVGTPAYMPPEQARGEIERIGPRSDVYAVGAMLYHLLARQMPFVPPGARLSNRMVLMRVADGPPTPLATLRRDLPAELAAICDKAMARDPADRYGDMRAMAEDLRAYLEGRVVRAYRSGARAEFGKWVSRNRGMAAAIGAAVLFALGGLAAIALVQARGQQRELQRSYVANLRAAESSLQANECADARRRLEQVDEELRKWEWNHFQLASDTSFAELEGSAPGIRGVAFMPDGRLFLGCDTIVKVWDRSSPARVLGRAPATVYGVAVSADGRLAATGGDDGELRLWDAQSGTFLRELPGHTRGLLSVAFSQDGAWIASGSDDNTLRIWDAQTFESRSLGRHAAFVACVAFAPDGSRVASASADRTVRIWSLPDGACIGELRGHSAAVRAVAFSPDGSRLATASDDRTIRTWDAGTFQPLLLMYGHTAPVRSVAYGADGSWIVSGSEDRTLRRWSAGNAEPLTVHRGHDGKIFSVACSADGQVIASASEDGTVRLWNPQGRDCSLIAEREVSSVAFSPDGSRLIAVADKVLRVRDAVAGSIVPPSGAVRIEATYAAPTSDGKFLVCSGPERIVRILNATTGAELQRLEHGPIFALAKDSTLLATGSKEDGVRIWSLALGAECKASLLRDLPGLTRQVSSLAFDPSSSRIAVGLPGAIGLYDVRTGDERARLSQDGHVSAIAFDPTGRRLVSGASDRMVRVWDAATGRCLQVLDGHTDYVSALVWHPYDSRFFSCSPDRTLRVWAAFQDAREFETVAILRGHEQAVSCLAFSPDGKRLASGAREGVRIWETTRIAEGSWSDDTMRTSADLLAEAEFGSEFPAELIASAWEVVRIPGNSTQAYERALHRAERAEELEGETELGQPPGDVLRPMSLRGAAYYRLGELGRARELMTQALETDGDNPVVLAFLAMTHLRLSEEGPAREFLERMQRRMAARPAQSDWGGQLDLRDLAREAGMLLGR